MRLRTLFVSLLAVLTATVLIYLTAPITHYRTILIHHTASSRDNLQSLQSVHRNYLLDAAYHLILSNGSTEIPSGHLESTLWYRFVLPSLASGDRWCDLTTVQLCIVGNYEERELSDDLKAALAHAVRTLQRRYAIPDERVRLHRDCHQTLCPGRNIDSASVLRWIDQFADQTPDDVRRQQAAAIGAPYLLHGQLSTIWTPIATVTAILLAWVALRKKSKTQRRD